MTEHTPTPWRVNGAAIWAADKSGYVAELSSPRGSDQRDIDAAFIVKAVNSHVPMAKALADALCELSHCADQLGARENNSVRRAIEEARRILAAVEGAPK